jgi:hypothetical protein
MYYGGWRHCNVVKLSDDFISLVPFDDDEIYKEVTPENYVEGPFYVSEKMANIILCRAKAAGAGRIIA